MTKRKPAETFSVWSYVQEELEERGLSISALVEVAGISEIEVSEMMNPFHPVAGRLTCEKLGKFFGTGTEFWWNHETIYRLGRAGHKKGAKK